MSEISTPAEPVIDLVRIVGKLLEEKSDTTRCAKGFTCSRCG